MRAILVALILARSVSALEGQPGNHRWKQCVHYQFRKPGDSSAVVRREILLSAHGRASYRVEPGELKRGKFFLDPSGADFGYAGTAIRKGDTLVLDLRAGKSRYSPVRKAPIEGWRLVDSGTYLVDARTRDTFRVGYVDPARQAALDIGSCLGCQGNCFVPFSDALDDLIRDPDAFRAAAKPMMVYYLAWKDLIVRKDSTLDSSQADAIRELKRKAREVIKPLEAKDDKQHFWSRLRHALYPAN